METVRCAAKVRIGLYGGTFDPIHIGHLLNAERVRDEFDLDLVFFIPADVPVHKYTGNMASAEERCEMIRRAIDGNTAFDIHTGEIDRRDPSYTVITVKELREEFSGDELFLIVGADSYDDFGSWYEYEEILAMVPVIVMSRPDSSQENYIWTRKGRFHFAENPEIEVSSSAIREYVASNRSIRYLVPEKVRSYIIERGLYKSER